MAWAGALPYNIFFWTIFFLPLSQEERFRHALYTLAMITNTITTIIGKTSITTIICKTSIISQLSLLLQ